MNKQKGFTAVEGLLILIAVSLIAFVGYYVWHSTSQTNKTLDTAANTKPTAPTKKATATTNQTNETELIASAIADKCHSNTPSLNEDKVKAANLSVFNISKDNLIVVGNFASANGTCGESVQPGGGMGFLFKKNNNIWAFVYEGQQQPDCEAIDHQGWPVSTLKQFGNSCYDSVTKTYRAPN